MKKIVFLLSLLITATLGFASNNNTISATVDIAKCVNADQLLESFRIIPLGNEYEFFESIDSYYIRESNDFIFILDFESGKIAIFDNNGHYKDSIYPLYKVRTVYTIMDFDVYNNKVCVICTIGNDYSPIACLYDTNGKFIEKFKLDAIYYNVLLLPDNKILLYSCGNNDSGYNYAIYDLNSKNKELCWEPIKNERCLYSHFPFNRVANNIFVTKPYDCTIYSLGNKELIPKFNLIYINTNKPPTVDGACAKAFKIASQKTKNVLSDIQSVSESKDNWYLKSAIQSGKSVKHYLTAINKKTNVVTTINLDDNRIFPFAKNSYVSLKNGYAITKADVEKLKQYLIRTKQESKYKDIMNGKITNVLIEFKLK